MSGQQQQHLQRHCVFSFHSSPSLIFSVLKPFCYRSPRFPLHLRFAQPLPPTNNLARRPVAVRPAYQRVDDNALVPGHLAPEIPHRLIPPSSPIFLVYHRFWRSPREIPFSFPAFLAKFHLGNGEEISGTQCYSWRKYKPAVCRYRVSMHAIRLLSPAKAKTQQPRNLVSACRTTPRC